MMCLICPWSFNFSLESYQALDGVLQQIGGLEDDEDDLSETLWNIMSN